MNRANLLTSRSDVIKKAARKRPQLHIDQESFDPEKGLVFIRGWVLSEKTVKLRIYDEKKNRVPARFRREVRLDILKEYQTLQVSAESGFYGQFAAEEGKLYYLAVRDQHGGTTVHRIISGAENAGAGAGFRKLAYSAVERAGKAQDYGLSGTAAAILGRAAQKAGRLFNYPTYWYDLVRTRERELESQRREAKPSDCEFRISMLDSHDGRAGRNLLTSLDLQTFENWKISQESSANDEDKDIWILYCRKDDWLEPDALYQMAAYIDRHPETELIYPDELRRPLSGIGVREILLKPDFSPDYLCSADYIGHVFAVRRRLAEKIGKPLRGASPDVAALDYLLKCVENTEHVGHVRRILFETREPDRKFGFLVKEMIPVIRAHYRRTGFESEVVYDRKDDVFRTVLAVRGNPKVSILIPNKDHLEDLKKCLNSIRSVSTWKNYEVLVIENNSEEEQTFRYYDEIENTCPEVRILYFTERPEFRSGKAVRKEAAGQFNYPDLNNYAAEQAGGDYIILLNNDTEVLTKDWMERMLGYCQREDTAIVGARLYYPDDTIQHAGVIVGLSGGAEHAGAREARGKAGYMKRYAATQNLSAVTAACMMIKKSVFVELGGLERAYPVAFNDVDFCLRARSAGYLVVYDADVELYHYESKSRGIDATKEQTERAMKELKLLQTRHARFLEEGDPYYHPWLHPSRQDYSLAEPERVIKSGHFSR